MPNNEGSQQKGPVTIKKYANRRLYNTASSSYVTLDQLCQMVKAGVDFVVYDAKTGEDITRSVLTQIIVEEESKGQSLLPVTFLRQIISFYGDSLQQVLPQYLDMSMRAFARNQEQVRKYIEGVKETFGGLFPFAPFEEMGKRNMAMFEQAMKMFAPVPPTEEKEPEAPAKERAGAEEESNPNAQLKQLETRLAELQRQFAALAKKTSR